MNHTNNNNNNNRNTHYYNHSSLTLPSTVRHSVWHYSGALSLCSVYSSVKHFPYTFVTLNFPLKHADRTHTHTHANRTAYRVQLTSQTLSHRHCPLYVYDTHVSFDEKSGKCLLCLPHTRFSCKVNG